MEETSGPVSGIKMAESDGAAMAAATTEKIGGSPTEAARFFDEVIAPYPQVYWLDGCEAPAVENVKIKFRLKPNAKPVRWSARLQPMKSLAQNIALLNNLWIQSQLTDQVDSNSLMANNMPRNAPNTTMASKAP